MKDWIGVLKDWIIAFMKEDKDEFYSEEEKIFYILKAVTENNKVIFDSIKEDIESLITSRLLAFIKISDIKISKTTSQQQEIVDV